MNENLLDQPTISKTCATSPARRFNPHKLLSAIGQLERQRLLCIARNQGLGVTRALNKNLGSNEILRRLPLSLLLLGEQKMNTELECFWHGRTSTPLNYQNEALAFCQYLLRRAEHLRVSVYLAEVLAYERANLILEMSINGEQDRIEVVHFEHDSAHLLQALRNGTVPSGLAKKPELIIGTLDHNDHVQWRVVNVPQPLQ